MHEPMLDLTISIQETGTDLGELDGLTRRLRNEIDKELDVEAAGLAPGVVEPGVKGDPITIGSIVVALASAGAFTGLVELLKSWALRREGRTVTLKARVGDQEVELAYSPAETSPEKMTQFVNAIMGTLRQKETPTGGG
ncbi:MAG: hypothetical protein SWK90_12475 [Chloroflexota bacterium]|nr:hypothetical protein [Chloroflexota bacterium]